MDFSIPKDYFLDEVRDGFFVPSMIKKSWAVSIMDYKILEEICDRLGLHLFFMYGSLIAVIRHAGSIPWDDDIDSMMLHDEYGRLKFYLDNGGLPENFRMNDYSNMGTGNLVRKWLDNVDAIKNRDRWEESFGFPFVNNIDVMILDYLPDGEEKMQYYRDVVDLHQYVKDFADLIESGSEQYDKEEFEYSLNLLERVLKVKYDSERDGKLSIWVWKMLDEFTARYTTVDGNQVASVAHYMTYGNGRFPKEWYQDFLDMPYEFTTVKVPVGYDGITRNFFGDYMTPQLEWDGHVYPFYKNLERALQEKYDVELLRYHYREEDVCRVLSEKENRQGFTETVASLLALFQEAHGFICDCLTAVLSGGQAGQELSDVLGSCQELAVQLGELAEARLAMQEDTDRIVHRMEAYCETVFHLFQQVSGEEGMLSDIDPEEVRRQFDEFEQYLTGETSCELPEKTKVLFLCWKSEHWRSLHTIWEAANACEAVDVTVIAVPYYIKNGLGEIDRNDMILDTEGYPDSVPLIPYDAYDLQAEHPDIVIYQCPYDEYSDAMTIHPYYYTSNLRKYAEKLVFVPPFTVREISPGDERSRYTIGCFISNPGVVYADTVIVQSDSMRDVYISKLKEMIMRDVRYQLEEWVPDEREYEGTDYVAEDQERIARYEDYQPDDPVVKPFLDWENKVVAAGSAITDWDERHRLLLQDESDGKLYEKSGRETERQDYDEILTVSTEWISKIRRKDGRFRKVLLYVISAGVAFEHGARIFEKAENAIRMIEQEHGDDLIVLVFADRNYRQALRKNNASAWTACQKFIGFVKDSSHIYDDSFDETRAAKLCDACYGDGSSIMNKCREYGRPVMIEAPNLMVDCPKKTAEETKAVEKTDTGSGSDREKKHEAGINKALYGKHIWECILKGKPHV